MDTVFKVTVDGFQVWSGYSQMGAYAEYTDAKFYYPESTVTLYENGSAIVTRMGK